MPIPETSGGWRSSAAYLEVATSCAECVAVSLAGLQLSSVKAKGTCSAVTLAISDLSSLPQLINKLGDPDEMGYFFTPGIVASGVRTNFNLFICLFFLIPR